MLRFETNVNDSLESVSVCDCVLCAARTIVDSLLKKGPSPTPESFTIRYMNFSIFIVLSELASHIRTTWIIKRFSSAWFAICDALHCPWWRCHAQTMPFSISKSNMLRTYIHEHRTALCSSEMLSLFLPETSEDVPLIAIFAHTKSSNDQMRREKKAEKFITAQLKACHVDRALFEYCSLGNSLPIYGVLFFELATAAMTMKTICQEWDQSDSNKW